MIAVEKSQSHILMLTVFTNKRSITFKLLIVPGDAATEVVKRETIETRHT